MLKFYEIHRELKPLKIKDGFLDDPDMVRKFALSCDLKYCDEYENFGNWPGKRSTYLQDIIDDVSYRKLVSGICDIIDKDLDIDKDIYNFESYFQLCLPEDGNSWIHQDSILWDYACIIYLTPDPEPNSGTIIYDAIECGYDHYNKEKHSNYIIRNIIENKYNRMAIYDSMEFHKSDMYFGNDNNDGRLTIVSFIKFKEDSK